MEFVVGRHGGEIAEVEVLTSCLEKVEEPGLGLEGGLGRLGGKRRGLG